jgi:hypothetical protein
MFINPSSNKAHPLSFALGKMEELNKLETAKNQFKNSPTHKSQLNTLIKEKKLFLKGLSNYFSKFSHFQFNQKSHPKKPLLKTSVTLTDGTKINVSNNFIYDFPREANKHWIINDTPLSEKSLEQTVEMIYLATGKNKEKTTKITSQLGQHQGNTHNEILHMIHPDSEHIFFPDPSFHTTFHLTVSESNATVKAESKFIKHNGNGNPYEKEGNDGKLYHIKTVENIDTELFEIDLSIKSDDDNFTKRKKTLKANFSYMLEGLKFQATEKHPENKKRIEEVERRFQLELNAIPSSINTRNSSTTEQIAYLKSLQSKSITILQKAKLEIADTSLNQSPSTLNTVYLYGKKVHDLFMGFLAYTNVFKPLIPVISYFLGGFSFPITYFLKSKLNSAYGSTVQKDVEVTETTPNQFNYLFKASSLTTTELTKQLNTFEEKQLSRQKWKAHEHLLSSEELAENIEKLKSQTEIQSMGEFKSSVTPLNSSFDESFQKTHGNHGYATRGRDEHEHLINGWKSQIQAGSSSLTFFRHASFAPLTGKLEKRQAVAKKSAQELLKGILINHLKETPEDKTKTTPITLKIAQCAVLSPSDLTHLPTDLWRSYGLDEKDLFDRQQEAITTLQGNQTVDIIENGKVKTIEVNVEILPFNIAVNSLSSSPGTQNNQGEINDLTFTKLQTDYENQIALWEKDSKYTKNIERVKQLYSEVIQLYSNESQRTSLEFVSRLNILLHELGWNISLNCKSGKDRTGHLSSRIKALFTIANILGRYPTPEEVKNPGPIHTAIARLHLKFMTTEDHYIVEKNIGVAALKSPGLLSEYEDVISNIKTIASQGLSYLI